MIKALIACYNDEQLLQWTLASLVGYVDEIIACVASWEKMFTVSCGYSDVNDATVSILEKHGAKVLEAINLSQIEHRDMLVNPLNNNDWGLVIDADETLYNPGMLATIEDRKPTLYQVPIYDAFKKEVYDHKLPLLRVSYKANRLFKKTDFLHYHKRHYYLFRGKELLWLNIDNYPKASLGIIHWRMLRDIKRAIRKNKFYNKRQQKVEEGLGHWSFWSFPTCWKVCKYWFGDTDFNECVNIKWGKCNAIPGKENIQTGATEIPKPSNMREIIIWGKKQVPLIWR